MTTIPPLWLARERSISHPSLVQFVLLSMLLHALAILLFGAPSGGSREGRALWGSLQVELLGAPRESEPRLKLDRLLAPAPAPQAREPAREGRTPPTPAAPTAAPPPVQAPAATLEPAMPAMPPLLDRLPVPERIRELDPPIVVPTPTEVQAPSPPARPAPAIVPMPVPVEAPPPPALPIERAPVETQALPVTPPAPLIERAPVETPALPVTPPIPLIERAPVEMKPVPVPPIENSVSPRIEAPPLPKPIETPLPKPVEAPLPREIPVAPVPAAPQPAEPRLPDRALPEAAPRQAPASILPTPATQPSPFRTPPSGPARPKDDAATNYDPTRPAIDLDAARRRAGQLAREGTGNRAAFPFPMPPPPERKTREQIAIENARKPDCRTAYQALGLAAVVPLIANEFGEGNCRW